MLTLGEQNIHDPVVYQPVSNKTKPLGGIHIPCTENLDQRCIFLSCSRLPLISKGPELFKWITVYVVPSLGKAPVYGKGLAASVRLIKHPLQPAS